MTEHAPPPETTSSELTRRLFLGAGIAATAGLAGCSLLPDPTPGTATPAERTPTETRTDEPRRPSPTEADRSTPVTGPDTFEVWEDVRRALAASPDHLPARANDLVESGLDSREDVAAVFRFVRDGIATLPPAVHGLDGVVTSVRWGVRGTLRGGAGTPREKAELLAELYRRGGLTAEVLVGPSSLSVEDVERLLFRPPDRAFAPAVDEARLDEWRGRLGLETLDARRVRRIDPAGRESRQLAESLRAALPDDAGSSPPFDFEWPDSTLIVRVETGEETIYADLFAVDVPFGDASVDPGRLEPAPEYEVPTVEVTLSASTPEDPSERIELVAGRWDASDLVGRQLFVATPPAVDPFARPDTEFVDVESFLPSIVVQGAGLAPERSEALSVRGDPVAWSGDQLGPTASATDTSGGGATDTPGGESFGGGVFGGGESTPDGDEDVRRLPRIAGLYVSVSVGDRLVEQTIAGWNPVRHRAEPVTQDMLEEVAGALFGSTYVGVEAMGSLRSVWFDEFLAAKGSVAEIDRALRTEDVETVEERVKAGLTAIPGKLFQLTSPLPEAVTDSSVTFPDAVRTTLYHQRPVLGTNRVVEQASVLPVTRFATVAEDPSERFRLTLEKTARLAVVEHALFEESTRSLLADAELRPWADRGEFELRDEPGWERLLERTQREWRPMRTVPDESGDPTGSTGSLHLVPASGTPLAYWNVDDRTGSLLGVLGDGTGGGRAEWTAGCSLELNDRVISLANLFVSSASALGVVSPFGAFVAGGWAIYGQTLSRRVVGAALALDRMDPGAYDALTRGWVSALTCSVAKHSFFSVIGGPFPGLAALSDLENVIVVMGASSPLSCGQLYENPGPDCDLSADR